MSPSARQLPQQLPAPFGRYRLLKLLGQGGMGTVYLAHDTQLDRRVALKVPQLAGHEEADVLARFYREARAAAVLTHPHICPMHDVGDLDGVPYLTMAFIEGKPLSEFAAQKPLQARPIAILLRKLALALQEAHKRGVIHRDLKPANIMIDTRGEPIIMDFGLARRARPGDPRLTQEGRMLGTPAYMSPEQVSGQIEAMGPACDIYSLGVILYELLTGRLPFTGDVMAMLSHVLLDEPPPPEQFRPDLDPELSAICLKAMAKKPTDRYATMADLAAALFEHLRQKTAPPAAAPTFHPSPRKPPPPTPSPDACETQPAGIPISQLGGLRSVAQLPTPKERESVRPRRPRRRKSRAQGIPLWIWLSGGAAALLLIGLIVFLATRPRAKPGPEPGEGREVKPVSDPNNSLTEQEKAAGWRLLFDGKTMLGWRGYKRQTLPERWRVQDGALVLRRSNGPKVDHLVTTDEYDDFELAFDWKVSSGANSGVFYRLVEEGDDPYATGLLYQVLDNTNTGEGRDPIMAAASCFQLFPVTKDRTKPVGQWNRGRIIVSCNVVEHWLNGERVVAYAIDSPAWQQRNKPPNKGKVAHGHLALEDGGTEVAYRNLKIRPLERGGKVTPIAWVDKEQSLIANIWAMHFSSDSRLLVGTGDAGPSGLVRIWETATLRELPSLVTGKKLVWYSGASFLPDGKHLLTYYSSDNNLYLWEATTGRLKHTFSGHQKPIVSLAVSPDGRFAVSGSADQTLRLWDLDNGQELRQFVGFSGVCSAVFSPSGKQVLGFAGDAALHLWDTASGMEVHRLVVPRGPCRGCFSPDGRSILSFGGNNGVRLWDVGSGNQLRVFGGADEVGTTAAYLPNGLEVATWGNDRVLRVWEVATEGAPRTLDLGADWQPGGLVLSPDGRRFLANHTDGSARLRDLATGAELVRFPNLLKHAAITFSPDGRLAACGSFRAGVYVLSLPTPPTP